MAITVTIKPDTADWDDTRKVLLVTETVETTREEDIAWWLEQFEEQLPNVKNMNDLNIWNRKIKLFNAAVKKVDLDDLVIDVMVPSVAEVDGEWTRVISQPEVTPVADLKENEE